VVVSQENTKQIIWAVLGIVLLFTFVMIDYQRLRDYTFFIYIFFIAVLVYTRLFGRVVNGAKSWIGFGELGIQPSEFVKVAVILYLAQYLQTSTHAVSSLKRFLTSFAIIIIPTGLVLIQPDFGTALVFLPILLVMVYVAGVNRIYVGFSLAFIVLTAIFTVLPLYEKIIAKERIAILFVFYEKPFAYIVLSLLTFIFSMALWGFKIFKKRYYFWICYFTAAIGLSMLSSIAAQAVLKEYQIMRLIVFLDPSVDSLGSGWNILQSITAIGSGGFLGKGYLMGTQSHYRYLPQQSTDFIFSIIAEEWGLLGSLAIFACFFLILWRSLRIVRSLKDMYAAYVISGIIGMIAFHFMINVGMVMGIMPITGIPLYFLSYGGSSLWAVMSAVGIILGISSRRFRS
jgi:rod shape determining protein RodA